MGANFQQHICTKQNIGSYPPPTQQGPVTFLYRDKTNHFDLGDQTAKNKYLTLGVGSFSPKIKGPWVTGPLLVFLPNIL